MAIIKLGFKNKIAHYSLGASESEIACPPKAGSAEMESRTRVIISFLILTLIVWGFMRLSDWLVPHTSFLEHVLHITLAVVPPFTAYVIFTIKALEKRRRAEEALLKSEEKYRLIFETAANLITSVNRDGIIVDCNTKIQSLLGYTPEEIIGQPMAKIIHPDYLDKANESLGEILAKGFSYDKEYKFIRKDGALIDLRINSSGLKNEKGEYYRKSALSATLPSASEPKKKS